MTLKELNSKYVYVTDTNKYGRIEHWTEMTLNEDGHYYGDCEDYSITVKCNIEGFQDWDYYWCRLNGGGHCVLSNGTEVIDNNVRKVVKLEEYIKMFTVTEWRKFTKVELAAKFAWAKAKRITWTEYIGIGVIALAASILYFS